MIDCTLVTCELVPDLDRDDRLLAEELVQRGYAVASAVWSDPTVDWCSSRVCVLRSTWDYHARFQEFTEWVDRASKVTTLRNPPELLSWNADKSYLKDLEKADIRIVPTFWAKCGERFSLLEFLQRYGLHDLVIKPARGAATHNVRLVHGHGDSLAEGQRHINEVLRNHDALVQPYLDSVMTYGERALVFVSGRFSHAVVKKPFDAVLAVSDVQSACVKATAEEVELATMAVNAVPGVSLYARVDLLRDDAGCSVVNEVELIEPALYFAVHAPARLALAEAIARELDTNRAKNKYLVR